MTYLDLTVTLSGPALLLEPDRGAVRTTTVSISDPTQQLVARVVNPAKVQLRDPLGAEVSELPVVDGQVLELVGLEPGPGPTGYASLRIETAAGTVLAEERVLTKALAFEIDAQLPTRNAAFTGGGLADDQDGFALDLASGIFAWSVEVLPGAQGRNGLAPAWVLHHNSRAYSRGGNFGRSPFDLFCFMRVRKDASGTIVWQEAALREYRFDQAVDPASVAAAQGGKTAGARYEVLADSATEVVLRGPDGSKLRFHPFDDTFRAGLLTRIENRFGDRIELVHDELGFLTALYDALGRRVTFAYDERARLTSITEDATTLRGRTCGFAYDAEGRLERIDTTPVLEDGGVGGEGDAPPGVATQFPQGKPYVLQYDPLTGDPRLDTNVARIVDPREVLAGTNTPRLVLTYGQTAGFSYDRVTAQGWGGTNATTVAAGGTVSLTYTDLGVTLPTLDDAVSTTEVFDRNGNRTLYLLNVDGLPLEVTEYPNREVRGMGVDPVDGYTTTRRFNRDEEQVRLVQPLGGTLEVEFDSSNVDRYAHGNVREVKRVPDSRGDGAGGTPEPIVFRYCYEPIFQQVRLVTSARGNDPTFVAPIAVPKEVRDLDFNLDGDVNDPADGETVQARRYTTETVYDYQEGTTQQVRDLALAQGVTLTPTQAAALTLGSDVNRDGLRDQRVGRPIEVRAPLVTLEDPTQPAQDVRTTYHWNALGQLLAEIDGEGYLDAYSYYPERRPSSPSGALTPNPPGRTLNGSTGGYLREVVRDDRILSSLRVPNVSATRVRATTGFEYDAVGNQVRLVDPRGVAHERDVNERNQTVRSARAADASGVTEPRPLAALHYETRTFFDANDNVVSLQVENVVDEGGGDHQRVAGNPWLETTYAYDLLDDLVEQTQEVSAANEARTIRGRSFTLGGATAETITTRYRYDRNQNQVLVISPSGGNDVTSSIVDERDLPWKSTRGGVAAQWKTLTAHADLQGAFGALQDDATDTSPAATTRTHVDLNGNVVFTIDAHDHGSVHDGALAPFDTADPTHPLGRRGDLTVTRYDGFDRVFTTIDPMGYQSRNGCTCGTGGGGAGGGENTYDPDGNALVQAAIGPETGNTRGGPAADLLLSRTRFRHDELSRVYRTEQERFAPAVPLGTGQSDPRVTVYATATLFDRNGRVVRTTRPLGDFTEQLHDGLDRVTMRRTNPMTGPAGTFVPSEVLTRYDAAGNAVQVEERERNLETGALETYFTDTFYDALGRPVLRVSPHFADDTANATRTEYDSRSNAVARLDANGSTTDTVQVDRDGARTLTINGTGNAVLQLHDGLGRVVQTTRELRADHDGAGALQGDVVTKQDWDASSRLRSVSDDNGNTTRFSYDELDRRTMQTNADGEVQVTAYDRDGRVTSFVDENGTTTTRTYDDLGRTLTVSATPAPLNPHGVHGPSAQTCAWDGLSRTVFCTDDNGGTVLSEVSRSYDSLSRLIACEQRVADSIGLVEAEFDANSNLVRLTYPGRVGGGGRRQVTYGYQDGNGATLNRIEQIEEGAGMGGDSFRPVLPTGSAAARIAAFSYIGPMRVASRQYGDGITGLGVLMTKGYDALRRNVTVTHEHPSLGGTFASFAYAFDRAGNRLNEVFGHEGVQDVYRYDSLGRLVREDRSAALGGVVNNQVANPTAVGAADARTWELDGANNWKEVLASGAFTSLSITANEMNEYELVNGVSRSHDDNGNLVDDGSKEYVYDAFNRLVRVVAKASGLDLARYAYDHGGRRVSREVDQDLDGTFEEQVRYFYLGGSVVEEVEAESGLTEQQYVWGEEGLVQVRRRDALGTALTVYLHENAYGSVVKTTGFRDGDTTPFPHSHVDYDAFGRPVLLAFPVNDRPLVFQFGGRRTDAETGFHCLVGGAYFDPTHGRTIARVGSVIANAYGWGGNAMFNTPAVRPPTLRPGRRGTSSRLRRYLPRGPHAPGRWRPGRRLTPEEEEELHRHRENPSGWSIDDLEREAELRRTRERNKQKVEDLEGGEGQTAPLVTDVLIDEWTRIHPGDLKYTNRRGCKVDKVDPWEEGNTDPKAAWLKFQRAVTGQTTAYRVTTPEGENTTYDGLRVMGDRILWGIEVKANINPEYYDRNGARWERQAIRQVGVASRCDFRTVWVLGHPGAFDRWQETLLGLGVNRVYHSHFAEGGRSLEGLMADELRANAGPGIGPLE